LLLCFQCSVKATKNIMILSKNTIIKIQKKMLKFAYNSTLSDINHYHYYIIWSTSFSKISFWGDLLSLSSMLSLPSKGCSSSEVCDLDDFLLMWITSISLFDPWLFSSSALWLGLIEIPLCYLLWFTRLTFSSLFLSSWS